MSPKTTRKTSAAGSRSAAKKTTSKKKTAAKKKAAGKKKTAAKKKAAVKKKAAAKKKPAVKKKAAAKKKTAPAGKTAGKKKPPARKAAATARKAAGKATRKKAATRSTAARKTGQPAGRIGPATGATLQRTEPSISTARLNAESYKKALKLYAEAMALVQKKQWKEAATLLADFISQHARERELCQRARTYLRVCSSHMNEAAETPERVEDFCLLATVRSNDGDHKEALSLLEKALQRKPADRRALYLKASTLALMGDRRAALKTLDLSIQADEQNRIYAANSPDFADLRDDEEFITMTTREEEEY